MEKENKAFLTHVQWAVIQDYIAPNLAYLRGINGTNLKSLVRRTKEITRLRNYISAPGVVVSVGVGEGEDLHAIHMLYGGSVREIIGIDLSQLALETARKRVIHNELPVELILGNATDLPLGEGCADSIILSSLLHEVYSYSLDGKDAWNKAIQESARVAKEDGCILIRDSAAPNLHEDIRVQLRTNLAREFYDYFTNEYRMFNGWDNLRGKFSCNLPKFPIRRDSDYVILSTGQSAELFFHLVNFQMGYSDVDKILNKSQMWKELNETYYIPRDSSSPEPMCIEEYVAEVINVGNSALSNKGFELVCAEMDCSARPRMYEPLLRHFSLGDGNEERLKHFINKMELVFKKVRKEE